MKLIGINGSPRKKWNTSTLIEQALEGAKSEGAETELINLYDLIIKDVKVVLHVKQLEANLMVGAM